MIEQAPPPPSEYVYHVVKHSKKRNNSQYDREIARDVLNNIDLCMREVRNAGMRMNNGHPMLEQLEVLLEIRSEIADCYDVIEEKR